MSGDGQRAAAERASAFTSSWKDAVARRDLGDVSALLADDVAFRSPVLHRPTEGRDAVAFLLGLVMDVFGPFSYTDTWTSEQGGVVLGFATSVEAEGRTLEVEGVDVFRLDEAGRVQQLTVMIRPLTALQAVATQMRQRLDIAAGSS